MSTTPHPLASVPRVVIRYPNQSGALVTVTERAPRPGRDPDVTSRYSAECAGCLDGIDSLFTTRRDLTEARAWANTHAATCRALPQPEHTDQPGGTA